MTLKQKVASLSDKFPNQRLQSHQTNIEDNRGDYSIKDLKQPYFYLITYGGRNE